MTIVVKKPKILQNEYHYENEEKPIVDAQEKSSEDFHGGDEITQSVNDQRFAVEQQNNNSEQQQNSEEQQNNEQSSEYQNGEDEQDQQAEQQNNDNIESRQSSSDQQTQDDNNKNEQNSDHENDQQQTKEEQNNGQQTEQQQNSEEHAQEDNNQQTEQHNNVEDQQSEEEQNVEDQQTNNQQNDQQQNNQNSEEQNNTNNEDQQTNQENEQSSEDEQDQENDQQQIKEENNSNSEEQNSEQHDNNEGEQNEEENDQQSSEEEEDNEENEQSSEDDEEGTSDDDDYEPEDEEQEDTAEYNTEEVAEISRARIMKKKLYLEFYRLIEYLADEEKTPASMPGQSVVLNIRKLMFRQYEHKPISSYYYYKARSQIILILDNSGSMDWLEEELNTFFNVALKRKDIEIYIAPNGNIEKYYDFRKKDFIEIDHEDAMNQIRQSALPVVYIGDFDGANTPVELSWSNKVYWICPETRYKYFRSHDWVRYSEDAFKGFFGRAFNDEEIIEVLQQFSKNVMKQRFWYDKHDEKEFEDYYN